MFLADIDILDLLKIGPFNESALTAVGYCLTFRDECFSIDEARVRAEEIGCPFHSQLIALAEVKGLSQPIPIFEARPKRLS